MATITNSVWRAGLAGMLLSVATAHVTAQAYTPPPPPLSTAPCKPTKSEPCDTLPAKAPAIPATADKFPFPEETAVDGKQSETGAAPSNPAAAPSDSNEKPAPANGFPFPGEPSAPSPAKSGSPDARSPSFPFPGEPDDSSSSSSSGSAATDSADQDGPKTPPTDAGSTGSTRFQRKHLAKVEDLDHRELEDLDVSHYYITTGNFVAAYSRAQDAVKLYPDDENAHIAVAIAAERLKKKEEATAEYQAYLKLAPDGEKAKQARRALQLLSEK